MNQTEVDWIIHYMEEFYCSRMEYLVDKEQYDDAHSIFEEFVVDGEEPKEYFFISYHKNIT